MASSHPVVLPVGISLLYMDEGAANIVYRFHNGPSVSTPEPSVIEEYGDGTPPPSEISESESHLKDGFSTFDNKLLRLRKDLPTTIPCADAQAAWVRQVAPLFPSHRAVQQQLVEIRTSDLIPRLNKELREIEREYALGTRTASGEFKARLTKRQGTYLANDEYGLLVEDMSADAGEKLYQFKPKWLAQSPSAPPGSVRCRTCAKNARINSRLREGEKPVQTYCPLDLVSTKWEEIQLGARHVMGPEAPASDIARFANWLRDYRLLHKLRVYQQNFDLKGVMNVHAADPNLRAAMTLRDCTLFLKMPDRIGEHEDFDARFGDLDIKSPGKLKYWQATERTLIEEGWYTRTEKESERQPLSCQLAGKTRELN